MASTMDFKLVFLGDTSVGKSCLVGRFVRDEFLEYQESTIGAAFVTKNVSLSDGVVKFEIWDTAGQERYRSLAPMYYRGAAAAMVVFDITNQETFDGPNGAKSWVKEIKRRGDQSVVIALVGNKSDLADKRVVDTEVAQEYAKANGLLYFEASAKSGHNVNSVFKTVAEKLPRTTARAVDDNLMLRRPQKAAKKEGCCG